MNKIKLITFVAAAAGAFLLNSCCSSCCTGVTPADPLQPLPDFAPLAPSKGK